MADWEMLSYFDTKLPTELVVDASPCSLGFHNQIWQSSANRRRVEVQTD